MIHPAKLVCKGPSICKIEAKNLGKEKGTYFRKSAFRVI